MGVLSDSYDNLNGAYKDKQTGDLPSKVDSLLDYPAGKSDEGRAMMQIIYDVVPGAELWFYTTNFGTDRNVGSDAYELLPVNVAAILADKGRSGDAFLELRFFVALYSGAKPTLMQIVSQNNDDVFGNPRTNSGTLFGHAKAKGAAAIAATSAKGTPAWGVDKMELQWYSSVGGIPNLFDTNGNRLPMPEIRYQPLVTAPDIVSTTCFEGPPPPGYDFPAFIGTSASAPHVAAVAALMLEANPKLTPDGIFTALEKTAVDMNDPLLWTSARYDFGSGYGFVDALAAVNYVRKPTAPIKPAKPALQPAIPVVKPAPKKPAPTKPAPTKPAPTKPAPTKPAPAKPAPKKPAPSPKKPAPKMSKSWSPSPSPLPK